MNNRLPPKFIITAIAILYVLGLAGLVFAQERNGSALAEDISDVKQQQAEKYRESGLEYQRSGNLAEALSFYQKAIFLYPNFALVYNDLGVVYEALGAFDRAEENYLNSIKINSTYAGVYTNLALFYENQRNLEKAAFYWNKRAALGPACDPWRQKAANRLRDIRRSLSANPLADEREEEVLDLMKSIAGDETRLNKIDENPAQRSFRKAKLSFDRGDITAAVKEALDAQYLDPNNPEIEAFIEKAGLRALTR